MYCYGDVVRVLEDMQQVCALQRGHGNWNDDMALVCVSLCDLLTHLAVL